MLKFEDVYYVSLGKLKTAIDDWSEMVKKLDRLAKDAHDTMLSNANKADWKGQTADVTKPVIRKTADEFYDAADEAKGIKAVLEDAYKSFKKAQDDLKHIVNDEAPAKGLIVIAGGEVLSATRDDTDKKTQQAADAMQKRIDKLLETCDDADQSAARALRGDVTKDKHNFSKPKYMSLDSEKGQYAASLAARGDKLTDKQLAELNELLKDNKDNQTFATTFYQTLGPKKALQSFGNLAAVRKAPDGKVDKAWESGLKQLQQNMGLNLATATDFDNKTHLSNHYVEQLRRLGTQKIDLEGFRPAQAYGYQLLGGIMRYGNYNPKFLNPIAEEVVQLHKRDPGLFLQTKVEGAPSDTPFNPSGKDGAGYDPVTSVLEALGHSPEASKEFFTNPPTLYDDSGMPVDGGHVDLGHGNKGYLDYLTSKDFRPFLGDLNGQSTVVTASQTQGYTQDALGHALESATLGHPYDDQHAALHRDATTAHIMDQVVKKFSDGDTFKRMSPMADSLGRMGAGYVDDLDWGMSDSKPGYFSAPTHDLADHVAFGKANTVKFLSNLGSQPDSYATMTHAQRLYTAYSLDRTVDHHGHIDEGLARQTARIGATVQGNLDQSRAEQVNAHFSGDSGSYNAALTKHANWGASAGTTLVSMAGDAVPGVSESTMAVKVLVPVAKDIATGALNREALNIAGDYSTGHAQDPAVTAHEKAADIYDAGQRTVSQPLQSFIDAHHIKHTGNFSEDLNEASIGGYNDGTSGESRQGNIHTP